MYEETKSSIDWKGIFLKVVIAFLIILIALQGFKMFKGNDKKENTQKETISDSNNSSTFAANLDKLTEAGEKYYEKNPDKIPTVENVTNMVTLNDLINEGYITSLVDENGKNCETESSYVTAVLEGNRTKIKANLMCGTTFSNFSTYLAENTETKTEETVVKQDGAIVSTKKEETSKTYSNTSNTSSNVCKTNCNTPVVDVKTETKVEQKVTINETPKITTTKPVTTKKPTITTVKPKTYYTVSFDENGGNTSYGSKKVLENNTVNNPGSTRRNGYTFIGWYLNGQKFDFNTPITRNITLEAKFVRNSDNYYYDDDYYYDDYYYDDYYYDDYYYDNDYGYSSSRNYTMTTKVYSLAWNKKGTNNVSISHTLKVPASLENSYNVNRIRIKKISYYSPLNTMSQVTSYKNKFNDTFYYTRNGGEGTINYANNLSTINKNAVTFNYSNQYKDRYDAVANGFDVTWNANYISNQCSRTFNVANNYTGAYDTNLCAYGIIYEVTWEIM